MLSALVSVVESTEIHGLEEELSELGESGKVMQVAVKAVEGYEVAMNTPVRMHLQRPSFHATTLLWQMMIAKEWEQEL